MEEEVLYPRRWAILVAMTVILVAIQFGMILPGGGALLVMEGYSIEPMQFSMIMSAPYLVGFLLAIVAGVLADRIGLNKVLVGGFLLCLIGSLLRVFSEGSFAVLMIGTVIMGFALAALNANSAKLLRLWFPGKANSFAMGVYTAGMSLGAALALYIGSHIADIQTGWVISATAIAVGLVIWLVLYRNHPDAKRDIDRDPIGQYLGVVLRNKAVWGISIFAFLVFGMTNVNGSYAVAALTALAGDSSFAAEAGNISSANTVITCIASMVLPVVFVARFKRMRTPAFICFIGTAILYCIVLYLPFGPITWVIYCILPLFMASLMPIVKMLPALLPNIEQKYLGLVGGVQATFQNLGMFLLASYVLSPIAIAVSGVSDGLPFYQAIYVGIGVLCILGLLSMFLFKNVRSNVVDKIADDRKAAAVQEP